MHRVLGGVLTLVGLVACGPAPTPSLTDAPMDNGDDLVGTSAKDLWTVVDRRRTGGLEAVELFHFDGSGWSAVSRPALQPGPRGEPSWITFCPRGPRALYFSDGAEVYLGDDQGSWTTVTGAHGAIGRISRLVCGNGSAVAVWLDPTVATRPVATLMRFDGTASEILPPAPGLLAGAELSASAPWFLLQMPPYDHFTLHLFRYLDGGWVDLGDATASTTQPMVATDAEAWLVTTPGSAGERFAGDVHSGVWVSSPTTLVSATQGGLRTIEVPVPTDSFGRPPSCGVRTLGVAYHGSAPRLLYAAPLCEASEPAVDVFAQELAPAPHPGATHIATLREARGDLLPQKLEDGTWLVKGRTSLTEAWRLWNFRP